MTSALLHNGKLFGCSRPEALTVHMKWRIRSPTGAWASRMLQEEPISSISLTRKLFTKGKCAKAATSLRCIILQNSTVKVWSDFRIRNVFKSTDRHGGLAPRLSFFALFNYNARIRIALRESGCCLLCIYSCQLCNCLAGRENSFIW